jgi:hypothetical protein
LRKRFEVRRGSGVTHSDSAGIPEIGGDVIEGNAFAGFVEIAEVGSGRRVVQFGSERNPVGSGVEIEGNAETFEVEDAEIVPGNGIAGIGGSAEPARSFGEVTWDASADVIHGGEIGLSDGIVLAGGKEVEIESFGKILADTETVLIKASKIILSGGVTVESRGLITLRGFCVIAGNAMAVFVKIAEKKLGMRMVLRGARTEPDERGVVTGSGEIFAEKKLGELMLSGRIARIGAGFEFGDGGDGVSGLLRARHRKSERNGKDGEKEKEMRGQREMGTTKFCVHGGPSQEREFELVRADSEADRDKHQETAELRAHASCGRGRSGATALIKAHTPFGARYRQRVFVGPSALLGTYTGDESKRQKVW